MAYKSFTQRFPAFKWVLLFAVLLTLPLTVFSVQHVSTNVQQHAMGDTDGPYCNVAPKWTLLNHTDYVTSVKFGLSLTSSCPNVSIKSAGYFYNSFKLSAKVPSGWSYKYNVSGCALNQSCYFNVSNSNSGTVYVTISRPSSAVGTYTIPLYASNFGSPISTKNLSYIVIK